MKNEILKKLEKLAIQEATPFCYGCYIKAPSGVCQSCGSDDLMYCLDGVGVEYGTDWLIPHYLDQNFSTVDCDEVFEQMIDECYGETYQIGFIITSTSDAIKALDPIAWELTKSEYMDFLIEDEQVIEFNSKYYWVSEFG